MTRSDVENRLATALAARTDATAPAVPTLVELRARASAAPRPVTALSARRRPARRLLVAAGMAAVLAGTTWAVADANHAGVDGSTAHLADPGAATVDATQLLTRIATAAEYAPSTPPRPGQFAYRETVGADVQTLTRNELDGPMRLTGTTSTSQVWQPQDTPFGAVVRSEGPGGVGPDGTPLPAFDGTVQLPEGLGPQGQEHPPTTYAELAALPVDDPAALVAALQAGGKTTQPGSTPAETTFLNASSVIDGQVLPPRLSAALYRAIAGLPGVTARTGVTDLLGRPALAVGMTTGTGEHTDILFDPVSLAPSGKRSYMAVDGRKGDAGLPTGAVAFVSRGIVDAPGQIPPG